MNNNTPPTKCLIFQNAYYTACEIRNLVESYGTYSVVGIGDTGNQLIDWLKPSRDIDLVITEPTLADGPLAGKMKNASLNIPIILIYTIDSDVDKFKDLNLLDAIPFPVVKPDLYRCLDRFEILKSNN